MLQTNPSAARYTERMSLADRIRNARRRARLSQAALAARIGVDRSAVSHWERGHGNLPSSANLLALANITGVRVEWLLHGVGSATPSVGREYDELVPIHEDYARDEEEEYLLRGYRQLSVKDRRILRSRLDQLMPEPPPEPED
ncbi:MAG: helix-turn-helix domain-containing protein [Xanthomonadaceae bacterium]|nr:helix-turn-helix domain-containing protein [Xanthomonadaceae bacterium]